MLLGVGDGGRGEVGEYLQNLQVVLAERAIDLVDRLDHSEHLIAMQQGGGNQAARREGAVALKIDSLEVALVDGGVLNHGRLARPDDVPAMPREASNSVPTRLASLGPTTARKISFRRRRSSNMTLLPSLRSTCGTDWAMAWRTSCRFRLLLIAEDASISAESVWAERLWVCQVIRGCILEQRGTV